MQVSRPSLVPQCHLPPSRPSRLLAGIRRLCQGGGANRPRPGPVASEQSQGQEQELDGGLGEPGVLSLGDGLHKDGLLHTGSSLKPPRGIPPRGCATVPTCLSSPRQPRGQAGQSTLPLLYGNGFQHLKRVLAVARKHRCERAQSWREGSLSS